MSDTIKSFGSVRSNKPGSTCIASIPLSGVKNALAVVVSYQPPIGTLTFSEAGFWGGVTILPIALDIGPNEEYPLDGSIPGNQYPRPIFEQRMHTPRDQFLFPLAELQGAALAYGSSALSVVLHPAIDNLAPTPTKFRGFLFVAGQIRDLSSYS